MFNYARGAGTSNVVSGGSGVNVVTRGATSGTSSGGSYDVTFDGIVDMADVAALTGNYARSNGSWHTWLPGDFNDDGAVNVLDLILLRNNCDCEGGESLMGGGGGGGEEMMGGGSEESLGGGEEMSGGGGESLLSENPARIYITLSGSTAGGGELPEEVPSVLLDGPEDSVTLYVWATMGDYAIMQTLALDVSATNENVVKATASTIANPNIIATNWDDEIIDTRWPELWVSGGTLNPNGVGDEALVVGARTGTLNTTTNAIHANWDGTAGSAGLLDEGYDATAGAFLLGSVTLEALSGSGGLSTDIVLSIGAFKIIVGQSGVAHPIYLGLGETTVANNDVGATDGTAHATISVAAQAPEAVVVRAGGRAATNLVWPQVAEATVRANAPVRAGRRETSSEPREAELRAVDDSIVDANSLRANRRLARETRGVLRAPASVDSLSHTMLA